MLDPAAHVVAAGEPGGAVVALASLIRAPGGDTAELGVLVEDAWQRRGIGCRLAANAPVADLLRRVPGQFSVAAEGGVLTVRVRLPIGCR